MTYFPKPCTKCNKTFTPTSRHTKLCDECWESSRNYGGRKPKEKNERKKGEYHKWLLTCKVCKKEYGTDGEHDNGVCLACSFTGKVRPFRLKVRNDKSV